MNLKKTLFNFFSVSVSNLLMIISSIIVGFVLPIILTVPAYGYYKTYTLFATYTVFLTLGIGEGVILKYGGLDYNQLERPLFRAIYRYLNLFQLICSVVILAATFLFASNEYIYILAFVVVNIFATNSYAYLYQVAQITQRFRDCTLKNIIHSSSYIVIFAGLFVLYKTKGEVDYRLAIAGIVMSNLITTIWFNIRLKEIVFGKAMPLKNARTDVQGLIKNGMPLLVSNFCSTLILTIDKQFVNVTFDKTTYAIYSFAYSILRIITFATTAMATVLYPILKRTTEKTMKENYDLLISCILVLVFAMEIAYFPLVFIVEHFIPKYEESLIIFRIVYPGLAISSAITVIMNNYYKAMNKSVLFFKKSVIVLGISFVANVIAYFLFGTTTSLSIASILTMIIWYLVCERYFVVNYKYDYRKNFSYMLLMIAVFYLTTGVANVWISCLAYVLVYAAISVLYYRKRMKMVMTKLKES